MKKTLLAVITSASLGMVSTVIATPMPTGGTTLQWAGSVPSTTVSGKGYWIAEDGGIAFTDGILTFGNTAADGIALNSSSEIGFKVVKDAGIAAGSGAVQEYLPGVDVEPLKYSYTLTNVKVGIGGIATTQANDGYFAVYANGSTTPSTVGTKVEQAAGLPTRLTVKGRTAASAADLLAAGDDVVVMAVVSVTPDDTAI
jgi:hypothetical protein